MDKQNCSWTEFDLGSLTYPQFLAFFFDRPVVPFDESFNLFRGGIDAIVCSDPAVVVSHLRTMCQDFAALKNAHSEEQIDQGLWAVFSQFCCEQYCFDASVDPSLRIDAIEAMYIPFRDVVALRAGDKKDSFYWMWWDDIVNTFWLSTDQFDHSGLDAEQLIQKYKQLAMAKDFAALTDDEKPMAEAIFRTLLKIFAIDNESCQWAALHGLGHLHHPLGAKIVQEYLDAHRADLSEEDVKWVESFRDGCCI